VHRHRRPERRHLLRKLAARFLLQPRRPLAQDAAHGVEQPRNLLLAQRLRQRHRRQPRRVQDLVRIGVADSDEDVRISQRA
jgi:hypothetical protein